jgi:hypothetical protein
MSMLFSPEHGDSRYIAYVSPRRWYLPTSPHGVTNQKTNTDIFTAMGTSDLTYYVLLSNRLLNSKLFIYLFIFYVFM